MGLEAFRRNGLPIDDFITIPQEDCQYENPDDPSCSLYGNFKYQKFLNVFKTSAN